MPEGDTIYRAAHTLDRALARRVVTRFDSVLPALTRIDEDAPIAGRTVQRVWSQGKHLLIAFSGDLVLRTHMRMNGSWHIYRPGERWQRSRHQARLVIETDAFVAVAFNVPVAEFYTARELVREPALRDLGPDLLSDAFDEDAARRTPASEGPDRGWRRPARSARPRGHRERVQVGGLLRLPHQSIYSGRSPVRR